MINFNFHGHIAPVFTPFHEDRSLNLDLIPNYAQYLKENNVNGVLVNGTTGEGTSLTIQERKQSTEKWAHVCKQVTKQTIMAQIGGASLSDVLELARHAEQQQVDALLCLPDLYFKPKSAEELIEYFLQISKAAPNTPLLYYHIPAFTNVNISMPEFLTKASGAVKTLVGIKFTSPDLIEGADCLSVCDGKYKIFLGADQIMLAAYAMGFDSAIATTFNIYPQLGGQILNTFKDGNCNLDKGRNAQRALTKNINNIIKHGTWVPTMKAAMNILSPLKMGPVRSPLKPLTSCQIQEIRNSLL